MAVDILEILRQRYAGQPIESEPDLNELISAGAQIEHPEPKVEPPSFGQELLAGTEAVGSLATGIVAQALSGYAGAAAAPFVGLEGATDVIEKVQSALTYQPSLPQAEPVLEAVQFPFEKVRESADYWGNMVSEGTGIPELGAVTSVAVEFAALFAAPGLLKRVGPIGKSNLLKLRRKLRAAETSGDFTKPDLKKAIEDVYADMKEDPAMRAEVERYLGSRRSPNPPRPGTARDLVRQRVERRRMAEAAGVDIEPQGARLIGEEAPLVSPEGVRLPLQGEPIGPGELSPPPVDIPQGLKPGFTTEAWQRTRDHITKLREAEVEPTAEFIGNQTGVGGEQIPLYNIRGGPSDGSTVTAEHLKTLKIKVPKKEITFESQAAKHEVNFINKIEEGGEFFDPRTKEYFRSNTPETVAKELEQHRKNVADRASKYSNITLEQFGEMAKDWWEGKDVDINAVTKELREFIYEKPRSDFELGADYMDFIDRGEDLLGIIKKMKEQRGLTTPRIGGGTPPEEGLVVAHLTDDGRLYYGSPRETHGELLDRFNIFEDVGETGFAGPDGEFLSRVEALKIASREAGIPAAEGGLGAEMYNTLKDKFPAERASLELNDGSISEPKMIKPEDRIAYMKEVNERRSRLKREQIETALEEGEDISGMLPEEAQSAYQAYKDQYEYSIESSEPRSIGEIARDVNTYLGEKGAISLEGLTHEQKMALQRLVTDAKRMVGDLTSYLEELGLTKEQIVIIRRHIDEIRKVEPETFGEPRQVWIDSRAIEAGDYIVKQRKPGRGKQAPPVYRSEMDMIQQAQEIPKVINEKVGLENPIRTLERADPSGQGLKQVYYDYREAEQLYRQEFDQVKQEIKDLRSGVGWRTRKRIGAYAISQQARGLNILKNMKVEVPTLTEGELAVYDRLRGRFEELFERIQRTREMIGKDPLDKVDNYFTFFRTFGVLEKAGIKINPLLEKTSTVSSMYAKYGSTPFRFGISRIKKGAIPVELDPFRIYEVYSETALRHIHLSPWVAKMNELMLSLPDPKTGALTWKLSEHKPKLHHFLRHWVNHISGHASPLQLSRRLDRGLSLISQNLAYSILGANIRSSLIQVTALRNTIAEIGFKHSLRGVVESLEDITGATSNRKFALKHSKVLDSRTYDAAVADAMRLVRGGKVGDLYRALGRTTLKPLQWLDMETAIATWNGAYKLGESRGLSLRDAVNFADDVVTRTQASALPGDLAPIQRSSAGKAFTLFQTFVINDWGFLTRDVLGLGNVSISNDVALRKVMTYVAATTMFNILLEDVVGVQSPFPTPIKDLRESVRRGDPATTTARKVAFGLLDPVPIVGSARYGKGPGGPVLELGQETVRSLSGAPLAKPLPEIAGRIGGVPGTTQIGKTLRARKRGESIYGQIIGRYSPTEHKGRRRRSNPLGGLKGLGGLSGLQ